jgi:hypothetical protein
MSESNSDVDTHDVSHVSPGTCGGEPDVLAHASSGTPPAPLQIDDPVCVDFDP